MREKKKSERELSFSLFCAFVRSFVRSFDSVERERERIPRCLSPRPRAKRMREKDPSREVWRARLLLLQKIDDSGDDDERSTRDEIVPVVFRKDRTDARAEEVSELLVFFTVCRKVTIFVPRQKQNGLILRCIVKDALKDHHRKCSKSEEPPRRARWRAVNTFPRSKRVLLRGLLHHRASASSTLNEGIVKTATACECEKTLKIRQKQHKKHIIIL